MDKVQQSLSLAVEDYKKADTSVWWDTGSCGIPQDCNLYGIVDNIKLALQRLNYQGKISIHVHGSVEFFEGLDGPTLIKNDVHCFRIVGKETINKNVIADMSYWATENKKPANILLISKDQGFSDVLHQLRLRRYNILLALLEICEPLSLVLPASTIWLWSKLLNGEAPDVVKPITCLPGFENAQPVSGGQPITCLSDFENAQPVSGGQPITCLSGFENAQPPSGGQPITCLSGFENAQPPSGGQKIWKKKEKGEVKPVKCLSQKIWKKKEKEGTSGS